MYRTTSDPPLGLAAFQHAPCQSPAALCRSHTVPRSTQGVPSSLGRHLMLLQAHGKPKGQGRAGQVAAEQILPVQRGVNPAFLLMGEELFLEASRESWLRAGGARCDPVTGCGIVSGAAACEVIDALTPGCFWAFKGCCSSFSPDLLQVLTDGLFIWIKRPQRRKYNYSLKSS